jgi:transposase-like protein
MATGRRKQEHIMRKWVVLMIAAGTASLGGCASTGDSSYARNSPREQAFPVDALYMQKVAAAARERGVDVRWINPPRLRTEPAKSTR